MYRIPEAKKAEIITALKANPHATQVTQQVGDVSIGTVWRLAKAASIELTAGNAAKGPRGPLLAAEKHDEIIAALKANPNARHVAEQSGACYSTVLGIAKAERIELHWYKVVTPELRKEIIAALKENPNARQVAQQIGVVSNVTVMTIAATEGIELARNQRAAAAKRAQIIAALKENPNSSAVGKQLGTQQSYVAKIAKAAGIELTAGKALKAAKPFPEEKRAEVIAALRENPNASQVSRQLDVDFTRVRVIAKEGGIALSIGSHQHHSRNRLAAETRQQIIEALQTGRPNARQIAREVGVSENTVQKIAKAEDIPLRGRANQHVVGRAPKGNAPDVV